MDSEKVRYISVRHPALRKFMVEVFAVMRVPGPHAALIADSLVAADLRGVDSHGVELLIRYVNLLRKGGVDASAAGRVISESGACLLYDGENGFGQVIADRCADHAIRLARTSGLAFVAARNSNHIGAAAYWAEKIARSGHVGVVMSTAGPWVPPFGGKSRRLGTNPISMAVPGGRWLMDMATTTAAHGKLTLAAERNIEEIPVSWGFMDSEGNPTTSRRAAEKGWSAPFGGYKGTALAMMVEILCAGFSGGPMASEAPPGTDISSPLRLSNCFLALDPARFMGPGECETRMGRLVDMVKSSEPARKDGEVLVAGEPELRTERKRLAGGIPIPEPLWERLLELAGQLKVVPLESDAR